MSLRAVLGVVALTACGAKEGTTVPSSSPPAAETAELALRVSDSVAIWFTGGRADTSSNGTVCRERVMEIRASGRSIPIPLLYTAEIPRITKDSSVEVHVWRHCVPADLYRVNLRSGQPTRVVE